MTVSNIVIVDRDRQAAHTAQTVLEKAGQIAHIELAKEGAIKKVASGESNMVLVDVAPQLDPRPFVIALRRNLPARDSYVYIALSSRDITPEEAIRRGCNCFVSKPTRQDEIQALLENGNRFINFYNWLNRNEENNNVSSLGAMMGCESVVQVLLSSIERADRYGEKTYMLEAKIDNARALEEQMGQQRFTEFYRDFAETFKRIRRQSDLFGRLTADRFVIIMQRPISDREPVDATARMHLSLDRFIKTATPYQDFPVSVSVQTLCIPSGEIVANHHSANQKAETLMTA